MASKTSYLKLYKWDKQDTKQNTITEMASNSDLIDGEFKRQKDKLDGIEKDLNSANSTILTDVQPKIDDLFNITSRTNDNVSSARAEAAEAKVEAEKAKNEAAKAKDTAENTQQELNVIVDRVTDSDAMSRQAAVNSEGIDKGNLKTRLDDDYIKVTSQLAETSKQLGDRKIVDAAQFASLQDAINFTKSINGILSVDVVNEPLKQISINCSIVGKDSTSKINCKSIVFPMGTKKVDLKNLEIHTDMSVSVTIEKATEDIDIENVKIYPGTTVTPLNETKRLGINASGVTLETKIKNLRIKNSQIFSGGIQLALCEDFLVQGNFIDGNWLNEDELIHVSYKSRGKILDNDLINTLSDAIDVFSSGDRTIISGNRIQGVTLQGIEAKVSLTDDQTNTSSDELGYVESLIITGNIIRDIRGTINSGNHAIGINVAYYDNRSVKSFNPRKFANGVIIANNIIEDFYEIPYSSGNPIFQGILWSGSNSIISNNIIRGLKTVKQGIHEPRNAGIVFAENNGSKNRNMIIQGNQINSDVTGFYIDNLYDSVIDSNIMAKDERNGLLPRYGIYINPIAGVLQNTGFTTNQIECKTSYIDSNNAVQQITGHGIFATGSSIFKDVTIVSGNKLRNASLTLYTAEFTTISQNTIRPKGNNPAIDLTATSYKFGNRIVDNDVHSDGTNYGVVAMYQKAFRACGNTFNRVLGGINLAGYIANAIVKDNMQLYSSGDTINSSLVRTGATGIDSATITQSENTQVIAA
ncbi:hypothetical protein KHA93_11615 [Bacillus sp. FJAT-49732]|uniref:Right handed beta helix domain-containing protein n=1 Tax=Lederbergia citrisecunda TaxID=2833583 RepID=A0A942TN00_9BACI|nr:hypothetical protein [Lederbergia citrisecunda]MBS4200278.1 hypothetical protein [Lederbergia citrisecunda]